MLKLMVTFDEEKAIHKVSNYLLNTKRKNKFIAKKSNRHHLYQEIKQNKQISRDGLRRAQYHFCGFLPKIHNCI